MQRPGRVLDQEEDRQQVRHLGEDLAVDTSTTPYFRSLCLHRALGDAVAHLDRDQRDEPVHPAVQVQLPATSALYSFRPLFMSLNDEPNSIRTMSRLKILDETIFRACPGARAATR